FIPRDVDFRMLSDGRDLERLGTAFRLAASILCAPAPSAAVVETFPSTYSDQVRKLLSPGWRNGLLTAIAARLMDRSSGFRARVLALALKMARLSTCAVETTMRCRPISCDMWA
ncbi:hypothetical protein, partial [Acinetobacter baumannii]|uniref:hypothetical protein n=1 Tax=Acinetobacter baumannii TaxID=470 RepID=UPI001D17EBB5